MATKDKLLESAEILEILRKEDILDDDEFETKKGAVIQQLLQILHEEKVLTSEELKEKIQELEEDKKRDEEEENHHEAHTEIQERRKKNNQILNMVEITESRDESSEVHSSIILETVPKEEEKPSVGVVGLASIHVNTPQIFQRKKPKPRIQVLMEKFPPKEKVTEIQVYQYSASNFQEIEYQDPKEIPVTPPSEFHIRWINIEGYNDYTFEVLKKKFHIHPLAITDMQDMPQRPKLNNWSNHLLMVFQMMTLVDNPTPQAIREKLLDREQVSILLLSHGSNQSTILTIQEGKEGDCWKGLRDRLREASFRKTDIEFLLYSLLDELIETNRPTLNEYGETIYKLELQMLERPLDVDRIKAIREISRELLFMHRMITPIKGIVDKLLAPLPNKSDRKNQKEYILSAKTRTYVHSLYDLLHRQIDTIDTLKDTCVSLESLYASAQEQKMNQIMYALTVVSTIFLPLTFLAGIYGMNFEVLPELHWKLGYLYFWIFAIVIVIISASIFIYIRVSSNKKK